MAEKKKLTLKKEVGISIPGFYSGTLTKSTSVAELKKFKEAAGKAITANKYTQAALDAILSEVDDKAAE